MKHFLLTWLLSAIALGITAYLVPDFTITSFPAAIVAAVVMGIVNAIVRPLLVLLTLPLTFMTLGLFLLVINALSLVLVAYLTPDFTISGFIPAFLGSIVLSLVSGLLSPLAGKG
ncbi:MULTISPECIES: phage holin family protein [unclassified Coleofasciculus]|uniref:phage holin family protein n=1 Tax=unclassified Coleofasciculus TaxID=2692782 RepID=UPI001881AAB1|nr:MULTISPECIES: phage holin family protein [unclassified Coleofasciculus]MBE9127645.1 phage holin family protein [Coleofasciculus sp. LEGE 07081]MBE9150970.1 phage holin family protein [Coleofasciculus sp. LEGE 07092]